MWRDLAAKAATQLPPPQQWQRKICAEGIFLGCALFVLMQRDEDTLFKLEQRLEQGPDAEAEDEADTSSCSSQTEL